MPETALSPLPPTETVTVRSSANVLPSATVAVTVTSAPPPFSGTSAGAALRSIEGVMRGEDVSSSSRLMVTEPTVRPVAWPPTVSDSAPSMIESFVGVRVNVPEPLVSPAAMSMSKSLTAA